MQKRVLCSLERVETMSAKVTMFERWQYELVKTLETRNYRNLVPFIERWTEKGIYDKKQFEDFKKISDLAKELTLIKMIGGHLRVSKETKAWALQRSCELGMQTALEEEKARKKKK